MRSLRLAPITLDSHLTRHGTGRLAWLTLMAMVAIAASAGQLAGCSLPIGRATATPTTAIRTPTPVPPPPTPTNVPAGWVVYVGPHFTIAYPKAWTYANGAVPGNAFGVSLVLQNAGTGEIITINETYGYDQTQLRSLCAQGDATAQLAGLPVRYTLDAGTDRTWYFITSHHYAYSIIALDAGEPQDVLSAHDAILATFRPDDPASGC